MNQRKLALVALSLVVAAALMFARPAQATHFCGADPSSASYYIDEVMDFTGNTCRDNTDLNDVTTDLRFALDCTGWSGSRYVNASAWPEDFIDRSKRSYGFDHVYGDANLLSVYAGHGYKALLGFGWKGPNSNRCAVSLGPDALLGRSNGAVAAHAMYLTSCTLNRSTLSSFHAHGVRQHFGYHNSPAISGNQPIDFYVQTKWRTNKEAWLTEMEDKPGWFTGGNSPLVLSYGNGSSDTQTTVNKASIRQNVRRTPVSTVTWYWYNWVGAEECP